MRTAVWLLGLAVTEYSFRPYELKQVKTTVGVVGCALVFSLVACVIQDIQDIAGR